MRRSSRVAACLLWLRFGTLTVVAWGWCLSSTLTAATYYVATSGSDTNSGAIASPFATVQRAQTAAVAGDIVFIRSGTYMMSNANISGTSSPWALVTNLTKSGSAGARINYWNYPGELPVFDFTNVKPPGWRVTAFHISGSWLHLRGIEITGVQVTISGTSNTQSECFRNNGGSNNIFEQCVMHDGMGIGFYLTGGSNNLVLNCDAYRNWDSVSQSGRGGNVDGFGGHPNNTSHAGNVFRGCRAWFNSDDGYDCINAFNTITFENCWAYANGYTSDFVSRGDGNGFKSGGYGAAGGTVPNPIPRHMTRFCLSVRNKASGIYSNHQVGGSDWVSNTAYQNATNYNMLSTLSDNDTDVPGYGHFMRNNLGFSPRSTELSNLDQTTPGANDIVFNHFTLPVTVTSADFESVTTNTAQLEQILTQPRKANGDLPEIALLHLVSGSDLIDSGTAAGFANLGTAPDLGAFEFGSTTARNLVWKGDGTANAWDLNTTANWLTGGSTSVTGTAAVKFAGPANVVFDDAGFASPSITLSGQLWPDSILVSGTKSYTFAGTGVISGTGSLTKAGSGTLTLSASSSRTGPNVITGGAVLLSGSRQFAIGTGPVTLQSGTLALNGVTGSNATDTGTFSNSLALTANQTGMVRLMQRGIFASNVTGGTGSTLNVQVNYTAGDVTGNWSGFSGLIEVTSGTLNNGIAEFRINNSNGFGTATINLGNNIVMDQVLSPPNDGLSGGTTQVIGMLTSGTGAKLGGQPIVGRVVNWQVGGNNANGIFSGTITDGTGATRITKEGSGSWTLTRAHSYTGSTTINQGSTLR